MIYEHGDSQWNDIDRGEEKNLEKNLSHCYFVQHKFHMFCPRHKPGPPW
jgi:hypothetical protein